MEKNLGMSWVKIITAVLIGGYFFYCALNSSSWHFIDSLDLIIHEAGHTVCSFFGEFIKIAAGSFSQVFTPLVFAGYFYVRNDYFSSNLLLSWVGYNFVNVSVYISDAVNLQLPLLGGDAVLHDWNYLLDKMGVLFRAHQIGAIVNGFGFTLIILSIVFALYYSRRKEV